MARPLADPQFLRTVALAVFNLASESGLDGMSMRSVAAATGLSTGTLNYHFVNKRGLVRFAIGYAYATPSDWSVHAGSTATGLRRLSRRYLLGRDEVRTWWRFWCAVTAHAPRDAEVAALQTETHRGLVEFFTALLRAGLDRGDVIPGIAPDIEAERFVAIAHGLALRQLIDPRPAIVTRARGILEAEVVRLCASRTSVRL